jgi:hypothetical protein
MFIAAESSMIERHDMRRDEMSDDEKSVRPASDVKFRQLYFRDLSTGLGLLEDGTVVRFIYENPRGGGNAFSLRIYEVEIKDDRSVPASMFNAA